MNSNFHKIILLIVTISFIVWICVHIIIGNDKYTKIKSIIPEKQKYFIKKYFFVDKFTRDLVDKYETREKDTLNQILNSQITFNKKNPIELSEIRKKIINDHILNDEQVSIRNLKKKDGFLQKQISELLNDLSELLNDSKEIQFEILMSEYYDLKSHAILLKKKKVEGQEKNCSDNDKDLVISISGHGGSKKVLNQRLGSNILNKIFSKCNDFLILDMPLRGMNSINWEDDLMQKKFLKNNSFFPGYKNKKSMNHHQVFAHFKDNKYPNKKPLSLMLSGNYYLLKKIIENNNYNKITMFGVSGGAWETLMLSAIIPQINKSISFSGGTMPLIYRVENRNKHYEDMEKNFFNNYSYIDLFLLATYDKDFVLNRKNYHIFNLTDPCCYTGENMLRHFKVSFQAENFFIKFFKSDKHGFNHQILLNILND